ncbi:hypothetical protein ACQYRI_06840 [Salmonella enterica]
MEMQVSPQARKQDEENEGECAAIYPARKEKTAQKEGRSNLKNPVSRSLKIS